MHRYGSRPASTGPPVLVALARTGADGWPTVDGSDARRTRIDGRAEDPPRRHLAFGDLDPVQAARRAKPLEPLVIQVREQWGGGIAVPPGERIAHSRQVSWAGFSPAWSVRGLFQIEAPPYMLQAERAARRAIRGAPPPR